MSEPHAGLHPTREPALRESEQAYRLLVETSHDLIWSVDAEGRWTFVNAAARVIYGHEPAEMLGRPFMDFQTPEQAEKDLAVFALIKTGVPHFNYETVHVRRDGAPVHLSFNAVVRRDETGRVLGTTGTARDITARARAEDALRASEARFRRLVDSNLQGVFFTDTRGEITQANDAFLQMIGYSREDLAAGRISWKTMTPPEYAHLDERAIGELAARGVCTPWEKEYVRKDGSRVSVIVGAATYVGSHDDAIAFALDITERKQLEEQLRQMQKLEAIGQLAGGVAHDFNNILTVIQGHITVLELTGNSPTIVRESIGEIKQVVERAANLTRQLLTFSRRQAMRPCPLDLHAVVTNMARMLQRILGEDISMELRLSSHDCVVSADVGMLEQVLLNLVVNSRDAMPRGGRLLLETSAVDFDETIPARIPHARAGAFACLAASDTGAGIPAGVQRRIFEPFFTTKEHGKGTGLGLATVYGIVQQHGGWIDVDSEVGRGTTFRVYLPRMNGEKVALPPKLEAHAARPGSETILLVEDEAALCSLVTGLLERFGYRVLAAATGPEALKLWREHHTEIHLLVTDVVLPDGISGFELGEQLAREAPRLRIIYTSGYSPEVAGRRRELVAGVNFLAKPFKMDRLVRAIRAALDQAKA